MTRSEWEVLSSQLDALRVFWRNDRSEVCGVAWVADYGPLPCDRPRGHEGLHRCYGSQGAIDFGSPLTTEARDG